MHPRGAGKSQSVTYSVTFCIQTKLQAVLLLYFEKPSAERRVRPAPFSPMANSTCIRWDQSTYQMGPRSPQSSKLFGKQKRQKDR